MGHPLDGAIQRINRSNRYIDEAKALIDQFGSECEDRLIAAYDPVSGQTRIDFPDPHPDLPLAISDACHNLRAGLDYLVYELALKDSGRPHHGTQFPIEEVKSGISPTSGNKIGFDVVKGRFLKGVSDPHIDLIEKMQPYNGADWAQDLKEISNPDKHKKLLVIEKEDALSVWLRRPGADVEGKRLPNGSPIYVDGHQTVKIGLPRRNAYIVSALHMIQAAAIDAVNTFYREF